MDEPKVETTEQQRQLEPERDPDETWSVPPDDLDATWPTDADRRRLAG